MRKCAIIHANFEMPSMKISDFNTLHSAKLFTFKYESTQKLGSKQNFTCLGLNTLYKNILPVKKYVIIWTQHMLPLNANK